MRAVSGVNTTALVSSRQAVGVEDTVDRMIQKPRLKNGRMLVALPSFPQFTSLLWLFGDHVPGPLSLISYSKYLRLFFVFD